VALDLYPVKVSDSLEGKKPKSFPVDGLDSAKEH
jgi:hypothetical protein